MASINIVLKNVEGRSLSEVFGILVSSLGYDPGRFILNERSRCDFTLDCAVRVSSDVLNDIFLNE